MKARNVPLTTLIVVLLIVLLPLLAVLQYRWLGQVSTAERERLKENWQRGASELARDFDRELARVFLHFQRHTRASTHTPLESYARRYADWLAEAPYPRLISAAWLVEKSSTGITIRRFTPEGTLEAVDWPPQLARYRERFRRDYEHPTGAPALSTELPALLDDVPAIVAHLTEVALSSSGTVGPHRLSVGHAVLRLDSAYVGRELLPALARRHFGAGAEYQLAIVTRSTPLVTIYKSDDAFQPIGASSDASAPLFSLRFEEFADLIKDSAARGDANANGAPGSSRNVVLSIFRRAVSGDGRRPEMDDGTARWQVVVKHRAGSLEAAVSRVRWRNLAISFGILGVLAGAVAVLLVSTRRAQRLARQQMDFVAGVSHELRTPLAVIRSAGANLADGVIDDAGQIRRYGALIETEGRRLTQMVDQVLDFSAGPGGALANARPVDMAAVLRDVIDTWSPALLEQGFDTSADLQPDLPPILGDADALRRALQNLLSNAQKYSADRKSIRIAAREAIGQGLHEVVITVEDRGIGIPPSDLPHVFEPFYRGTEATASQIRGTGLGLSLVKQTVEAHGGRVRVDSAPGNGARFTLHFPAATRGASAGRPPRGHIRRLPTRSIHEPASPVNRG